MAWIRKNIWRLSCAVIAVSMILIVFLVKVDTDVRLEGISQSLVISNSSTTPVIAFPQLSGVLKISHVDQFILRENRHQSARSEHEIYVTARAIRIKNLSISRFEELRFSSDSRMAKLAFNSSRIEGEIRMDGLSLFNSHDLNSDKVWTLADTLRLESLRFTATPLIEYPALTFQFVSDHPVVITDLSNATFDFEGNDLDNYKKPFLSVKFASVEINDIAQYNVQFTSIRKLEINTSSTGVKFSLSGTAKYLDFNGKDFRQSIFDEYFTNKLVLLSVVVNICLFLFPEILRLMKSILK